jgi:hypothetical protein
VMSSAGVSLIPSSTRPGERYRQSALCLDGLRIERQCVLEQDNSLTVDIRRRRTPPENVVKRVGMRSLPGGLGSDQLDTESIRDPARSRFAERTDRQCRGRTAPPKDARRSRHRAVGR